MTIEETPSAAPKRRQTNRLSAAQVNKSKLAPGRYSDGEGLYLWVKPSGSRQWVFRYNRGDKRTDIGLGTAKDKPLAVAREEAAAARALLAKGLDPLMAKRDAAVAAATLSEVAGQFADAFANTVKPAVVVRWRALARLHFGTLAATPVDRIDTNAVTEHMTLLQAKSMVVAAQVRAYLERVLDFAKVKKHRTGENPARLSGNLALVLPPFTTKTTHHESMPYGDLPSFYKAILDDTRSQAMCLRFIILTAARRDEVRRMVWAEVDMAAAVWTCPAERMKGKVEHRVPLSKPALGLLRAQHSATGGLANELVFPGRGGKGFTGYACARVMQGIEGAGDFTVHGFRATFSCYMAEQTDFGTDMADRCLAHVVDNQVTKAYMRSDLLDKRRPLMDAWAAYVAA